MDSSIIGALMILVPGLLITNSMRDIIYGDTNSGINRIVQVLLSAFAIALGTAAAWRITSGLCLRRFERGLSGHRRPRRPPDTGRKALAGSL